MKKTYTLPTFVATLALAAIVLFAGGSSAYADTVYTAPNGTQYSIPMGFQAYNYGVFFNPSTGVYFNPVTGQSSQTAPTGPAQISNGVYVVPSGYALSSFYGTYYNQTTGMYYDPVTGITSASVPSGPALLNAPTDTTTPGLPNTGAGGEAAGTIMTLAALALATIGGVAYLARKKVAYQA